MQVRWGIFIENLTVFFLFLRVVKPLYGPMGSVLNSGFLSMKRRGVLLLPPGWDACPSQGYPQHICWYPFVHLGEEKRCVLPKNTTQWPRPRTRTTRPEVGRTNHEATAPPQFLRVVLNIPIQTLIISPWLLFRKMIISQLELGPPVVRPDISKSNFMKMRSRGLNQFS